VSHTGGNLWIGHFLGEARCRQGRPTRLFNIGRGHFFACGLCRTCIFVGSNVLNRWREETQDLWRANRKSVEGYEWLE
jgi:hypothetical protein